MSAIPPVGTEKIDTSRPHSARVYDWFLGGKDNFPVDEELGRQIMSLEPATKYCAQHNRWFMQRATRHLAEAAGIRQFLDIGSGIPTEPSLHRIAQSAAPEARVVYVDNDPIVLAHAEALLTGTPEGATEFLKADVRDPAAILEQAGGVLDFGRPCALSLISLMHFISDDDGAYDIVERFMAALAPGSHLVLSQMAGDFDPERTRQAVAPASRGCRTGIRSSAWTRSGTGLRCRCTRGWAASSSPSPPPPPCFHLLDDKQENPISSMRRERGGIPSWPTSPGVSGCTICAPRPPPTSASTSAAGLSTTGPD
ncbi:SAM-dependent methyltransferase [Streptomyces sp. NPDC021622]|uniref:SAM-dependent methyltransferase n=1 Tax=Streptomyces sp. NPDC021622 TaxID=3155013 RepID=UPI003407618E